MNNHISIEDWLEQGIMKNTHKIFLYPCGSLETNSILGTLI